MFISLYWKVWHTNRIDSYSLGCCNDRPLASLDSTRLDSTRLYSTRLDSTRLYSTLLDSTRLASTRLYSTLLDWPLRYDGGTHKSYVKQVCLPMKNLSQTQFDPTELNPISMPAAWLSAISLFCAQNKSGLPRKLILCKSLHYACMKIYSLSEANRIDFLREAPLD
jgi:hypothetical protein